MAQVELIMPKMGESIMEATILKWLKQPGDPIEMDEAVLEIATDKVDSEVPSQIAGTLAKVLFQEGDVVEIGKAIAIIATEGEEVDDNGSAASAAAAAPATHSAPVPIAAAPAPAPQPVVVASTPVPQPSANGNGEARFYSPLVLNIARQEGIGMAELETVGGSGKDGRVSKKDILNYVKNRGSATAAATQAIASAPAAVSAVAPITKSASPSPSVNGNVEIVEMDRMRKVIAKHMVHSVQTAPHVTSFVEADVTNIVNWRNKVKDSFLKRTGEKMTFTPIFVECVAKALIDFPLVNVSIDGDNIIIKKDINIGMAAATSTGNLIVPVIKGADQLNLTGLAKQVNDLANRARSGKLKPDEIDGGTYTISNVGTFGNVMGTPIINQPQAAILAVGAIRKKPAVIETLQGDFIGIRQMMFLSHSYDHRIVDGMLGGSFVKRVADYMEAWDPNRGI
ncbi:MAG: 2-oxoglutarate dehydrogenase E2 component (dihydrolipoamide succinyltransferase) [Limisphaerales bacterium]|jgi:2-oxoglutarate dehydrogenase E2 component (dihydrolipoamide succinyltransferase)